MGSCLWDLKGLRAVGALGLQDLGASGVRISTTEPQWFIGLGFKV